MDWSRRFDDPIKLPGGMLISTLEHARDAVLKLPLSPEAEIAAGTLLKAAEHGGPFVFMARIATSKALHGPAPSPIGNPAGAPKTRSWGKRRLKRDACLIRLRCWRSP